MFALLSTVKLILFNIFFFFSSPLLTFSEEVDEALSALASAEYDKPLLELVLQHYSDLSRSFNASDELGHK